MKVLVVGSGGREHALVWKIAQSPMVEKIYCAPGNGGMQTLAECIPVSAMDIEGMVRLAKHIEADLVVVAPDDPLAAGMVDEMEKAGIRAFGPNKAAAVIESSKVFSKNLMKKYNIPTAAYEVFDNSAQAINYLKGCRFPQVIKADGLAFGKGVIIAEDLGQADEAVKSILDDRVFGNSGSRIIIEEFLKGPEVSILAFTDGKTIVPMVSSQDHKRAFDNDSGPNTGGMGTFSPSRIYTTEMDSICMKDIYIPTINAMKNEGREFKGVVFFGLIITEDGPKVLEYNARFGDPEAQVVLPRLETDLVEIMDAVIDKRLHTIEIKWSEKAAVCVILASGGYPIKYENGFEISGLQAAEEDESIIVFHAGTRLEKGRPVTSGGRVLGVTALGGTLDEAVQRAYNSVNKISFNNMHYRKDIGIK